MKRFRHIHRESHLQEYPSRRHVRVRPRIPIKPSKAHSPSRIYLNSVPELAPIRTLPAEFVGPNGEYDEQGLAKQIILEISRDPELESLLETLEVTQQKTRVIFTGHVPSQALLTKVIEMSETVRGLQSIEAHQVIVLARD